MLNLTLYVVLIGILAVAFCGYGNNKEEKRSKSEEQEEAEAGGLARALEKARQEGNDEEVKEILQLMAASKRQREGWDDLEPVVDLQPAEEDILVKAGQFSLRFGINGQVKELKIHSKRFPSRKSTIYRLNMERASVVGFRDKGNGIQLTLRTKGAHGIVSIEGGDRLTVRFSTDAINVTFGLGLPLLTRFHVVRSANIAQIVDGEQLEQEPFNTEAFGDVYQLMLAEFNNGFLSIGGRSDYQQPIFSGGHQRACISRLRHRGDDLAFEWTWRPASPLTLNWHETMEDAAAEYRRWVEDFFHVRTLAETPGKWVGDLKLLITLDMWRSNGDIAHTYQHAIDLAEELHEAGASGDILFYIPGWCGKYDAAYPDYTPKEELGGEAEFQEMVNTFHQYGYRVMIHVLPWGSDPYLPGFDKIRHLASSEDDVPSVTWPACYPATPSDFDSGRRDLSAGKISGRKVILKTMPLPRHLEAHVTVGGMRFPGSVKLSTNYRSLTSPKGYLAQNDAYAFPYTFLLYKGENEVTLEFIGADVPDLSRAWYRIHEAIYSDMIWTHPIVGMNVTHPDWIKLFTSRVVDVVRRYGIDAVHVDAQHLWDLRDDDMAINRILRAELPEVVFSTEKPTEPSMVMFQLAQNAAVPIDEGDEAAQFGSSPLARLLSLPYRRHYLHLCAADGFVPVATVCTIDPRPHPQTEEELEFNRRRFDMSPRFGVLRNIRVNYRDYGLDEETKRRIVTLYH